MKQADTNQDEELAEAYKKTHSLSGTARAVGVKYGFAQALWTTLQLSAKSMSLSILRGLRHKHLQKKRFILIY